MTRRFVERTERLERFFLPPYSPELNPDEWMWKNIDHDRVGRQAVQSHGELRLFATGRPASAPESPPTRAVLLRRPAPGLHHRMTDERPPSLETQDLLRPSGSRRWSAISLERRADRLRAVPALSTHLTAREACRPEHSSDR
ncbi:transposase [Actinomadura monticuli]|uniref:transposase n=1 Tax=Actinomadura monticuli TaxID=3097367 RepID=UPI0035680E12